MSLLGDLMTRTLDEGYAQATARRRAAGEPAGGLPTTGVMVGGVLLVGLLLATAAADVRSRDAAQDTARAALVAEVRERTAANDRLEAQVRALREDIGSTRREALELTAAGGASAERLGDLEARSGAGAVSGPGIVVTVDDAREVGDTAGADPRDEEVDLGRVQDSDLQTLVNGLWAAGAEAVAVNGQRLTSLTAIRSAGEAVLVAYRPLSPPYVVQAVGEPAGLEVGLLDSDAGLYLQVLRENYGIQYDIERSEQLDLPAASGVTVRHADVRTAGPLADATPGDGS